MPNSFPEGTAGKYPVGTQFCANKEMRLYIRFQERKALEEPRNKKLEGCGLCMSPRGKRQVSSLACFIRKPIHAEGTTGQEQQVGGGSEKMGFGRSEKTKVSDLTLLEVLFISSRTSTKGNGREARLKEAEDKPESSGQRWSGPTFSSSFHR